MKKIILLIISFVYFYGSAQAPTGYYDGTAGLTGAALKTKLSYIISNGHKDRGYNSLYSGYLTSDTDRYYENDGTVLDMYSENPYGTDPYNYNHTNADQCGNYNVESDCYNREHTIPQSFFNSVSPMVSDIHHITPTDGKVNGMRSNFPFGVVNSPSWTSRNGSKVGPNTTSGYSGTVFEPLNEFKGDIARMIFYFVTRYENRLSSFSTENMLGGSPYPGLQKWELDVLLAWHQSDPVSQREIDRNNAAYNYQGNRNPYIDHPQWVADVWAPGSTVSDTVAPTVPANVSASNITGSTATITWSASTDNIGVTGYNVYLNGVSVATTANASINVNGLSTSTSYIVVVEAFDASGNISSKSSPVTFTTTATPPVNVINDLYISEYIEGSSNNKAIEISNITGTTIDLSAYSIQKQVNSSGSWTAKLALTGLLESGSTIVIKNAAASFSCSFDAVSQTGAPIDFNGNDPVGLFKNNQLIDIVGTFDGASANFAADTTLRRNVVTNSTTFIPSQWDKYNVDTCDNLGLVNPTVVLSTKDNMGLNISKLSVSPNPARNGIIQISGLQENTVQVEIYNTGGQLLQTEKISKNNNKLHLKNFPKGLYVLKAGNQSAKFLID